MVSVMSFDRDVVGLSVANSDWFILRALERLNWGCCTYEDIALASEVKCDKSTVYRSLGRLQKREMIEQVSRSKQGCVYRLRKPLENA